jgi:hypothetical protein
MQPVQADSDTCCYCDSPSSHVVEHRHAGGVDRRCVCNRHQPGRGAGAASGVARHTRDAVGVVGLWLRRVGGM